MIVVTVAGLEISMKKIIKNLSIRVSRENVTDLSTIDKVDIERMMLEYERL